MMSNPADRFPKLAAGLVKAGLQVEARRALLAAAVADLAGPSDSGSGQAYDQPRAQHQDPELAESRRGWDLAFGSREPADEETR
jgi:hypothetical protein